MILNKQPTINENCEIKNTVFGIYNEVGKHCFLENVTLGDYSYIMEFCYLQNTIVHKFANIAAMTRIRPTDHPIQRVTQHHFTYRRKLYGFDSVDDEQFFINRTARQTIIGNDTWIGHGAIIMPEVTIGDGAVIGSGAIVTKDIPAYAVAVGAPAQTIKMRFDDKTIEKLLTIRWWEWSHNKIKDNFADFLLNGTDFAEKYYKGGA